MFLHLVVLLSLSWPVIGNANLQDEAFDQVATASENVAQSAREQKEFRDQLIPSMIDTTVYENSNGFVPMLVSSTDPPASSTEATNVTWVSSNESSNSSVIPEDEDKRDNIEHDPAYSTEARIFLNFPNLSNNRRSFEYQASQNEFELLKVRNDTPVVANYPDFYEDPTSSEKDETRSRHRENGQKMQDYGYGMVLNKDGHSSYEDYYSRNIDKEKKSQVKANVNYHQQDSLSYDGHGQTSTRQNGPTTYFSRSNPANAAKNEDLYDSVGATSQISNNHHKFSRPVVVAEPDYNYDHRSRQKSNSDVDDYQTSRVIDSGSSEVSHYTIRNRDGRFRSEEDSRDVSDERDYVEYTERPRRVQKNRRRPSKVDSKRLPKEHRGDSAEYESKRHHSRSKSHRQRVKNWFDEDRHQDQEESYEDSRYDDRDSERHKQSSKFKPSSAWNQVSPNLEISHSNGVEIGQLEKPKLIVPVKVNLVPVANFDHSTAIGNSQGFDVSNAVLHNIVTPINTVTTSSPVMSTAENLDPDSKIRVSTPVPDIIVGQNSYQNSIQAILPQTNDQNNFSSNFKPQFMSTTVAPVYAVTPSLQSIAVQNVHGASTPRPTYGASNQHHSSQVQANVPQLMVPQPTLQTYPTLLQTPIPGSNFNIQVNPHGMHGQNFIDSNLQMQSVSTMSTVAPTQIPVTKFSLLPESQGKKTLLPSNTNFVGAANVAVAQNDQRQLNGNSYYLHNSYHQQVKPQMQGNLYQQVVKNAAPKTKTYVQTTHILPALLHPFPTIATLSSTPQVLTEHQNQQYVKIQNTDNHSLRKLPSLMYQNIDNAGSHSTSSVNVVNAYPGATKLTDTAHLPYVGTGNVEILNPNIKPSPLDTAVVNSYEAMHYPATVLTTSIPMFTTTSLVTARPALFSASTTESANVQNLVNSLTEIGSKNNQQSGDSKAYQSLDRPMFDPMNFVPNSDLVKSQSDLNSKLHAAEPLQPDLNLVPLIPGGNFFKPSFTLQSDLLVKPKLNLDLDNYAEQMFKESLKTMYNTQKWNNDRKPGNQGRQNASDFLDIAKLRNEVQRLKAYLFEAKKNKDHLEGHPSETKVQTAELPSKKPDDFLNALEQMFQKQHSESHSHHGKNKPRHRRPEQDKQKEAKGERFKDSKHPKDFMTPPKPYRSKGHFHDKPGKKRPYSGPRYHHGHYHGPRSYPRHHFSHKTSGPEALGSNHDPVYSDGFLHREAHDSRRGRPEFRKGPLDSYSSFSAPLPDKNGPYKGFKQLKGTENVNQSKMHNLMGMWMKNKQLPEGNPSYFRDQEQLKRFFEDEKQRLQKQFYDDTFKDYSFKNSEGFDRRSLPHNSKV
ncbi:uncharacterized protein LOC105664090 [Megachile rotundata]|uniref:uncharacterized protein LOC105664090 n=1 Tax=Megachile rotundata TaxID=143995 RepID=UPI003FD057BE